jgi:hypothetical protein
MSVSLRDFGTGWVIGEGQDRQRTRPRSPGVRRVRAGAVRSDGFLRETHDASLESRMKIGLEFRPARFNLKVKLRIDRSKD